MENIIHNKLDSLKRQTAFLESDAYSFYNLLSQRRLMLAILRQNYFDLIKIIEFHDRQDAEDRFWNREHIKYRWKIQRRIIRLISNYLASLSALIDYSRKQIIPIIEQDPNAKSKKEKLFANFLIAIPSHKFIVNLRNISMHESALNIASENVLQDGWEEAQKNVFLHKKDLLKSKEWKEEGKLYLNSLPDRIYIIDMFKEHINGFLEYQSKLFLVMLSINPVQLLAFRTQFQEILSDAKENGINILPFNFSYIRYLDLLSVKSQQPN